MNAFSLNDCTVDELIEHFPELMGSHHQGPQVASEQDLLGAFQSLDLLPYSRLSSDRIQAEQKRKDEAVKLTRQAIATRIAQRFPLLDQRLFNLERWLMVEWQGVDEPPMIFAEQRSKPEGLLAAGFVSKKASGGSVQQYIKIPLVLRRLSGLGKVLPLKHPKSRSRWQGLHSLTCQFPGSLNQALVRSAHEATAIFYEALAQLSRSDWAYLAENLRYNSPSIDALWIPRLCDIGVVITPPQTRDPALVVSFNNQLFLVGTWQAEEDPIEALISEFT